MNLSAGSRFTDLAREGNLLVTMDASGLLRTEERDRDPALATALALSTSVATIGRVDPGEGPDERDFLEIAFAAGDRIFVPVEQIARVTRYSGGERPQLSKLGGTDWLRTKQRVRKAVAVEVAYEISPGDNLPAPVRTQALLFHTRTHLVVGFRAFDPEPAGIRATLRFVAPSIASTQSPHLPPT